MLLNLHYKPVASRNQIQHEKENMGQTCLTSYHVSKEITELGAEISRSVEQKKEGRLDIFDNLTYDQVGISKQ